MLQNDHLRNSIAPNETVEKGLILNDNHFNLNSPAFIKGRRLVCETAIEIKVRSTKKVGHVFNE